MRSVAVADDDSFVRPLFIKQKYFTLKMYRLAQTGHRDGKMEPYSKGRKTVPLWCDTNRKACDLSVPIK